MIRITVYLRLMTAQAILENKPTAQSLQLIERLEKLGVILSPSHLGVNDAKLKSLFEIEVADASLSEPIIKSLKECSAVDAVYLKPPDTLA
jgi:hypothetical protein